MKKHAWMLFVLLILGCSFSIVERMKPVLYIIGDSTVKNGSGMGADKLWGWGSFLADYFDTTKITVENHAIGGRSSRTFITDGRWDKILSTLKKGDYVIMQFGHNDSSPLDDTARARGTIKGIGDDSIGVYNPVRKMKETVHSYGWYMRRFIKETQAKGATPIVCSPIPRNNFIDGKVQRANNDYALWSHQLAAGTGAQYIALNDMIADKYDSLGADAVAKFFPVDHTHPNEEGSRINVELVVKGIRDLKNCRLKENLKQAVQH
jgi:rhamnogalacturonan acetylesterase